MEGWKEGRVEVTGRRGRKCKQLLDGLKGSEKVMEIERGSTRSHCVENSFWKFLRTFPKTTYGMIMTCVVCGGTNGTVAGLTR